MRAANRWWWGRYFPAQAPIRNVSQCRCALLFRNGSATRVGGERVKNKQASNLTPLAGGIGGVFQIRRWMILCKIFHIPRNRRSSGVCALHLPHRFRASCYGLAISLQFPSIVCAISKLTDNTSWPWGLGWGLIMACLYCLDEFYSISSNERSIVGTGW